MPDSPDTTNVNEAREAEAAKLAEEAREAHAAKSPEDLAYEAGRDASNDPLARQHGVDANPFSPIDHPDQRAAWLNGFSDALDEMVDIEALRKALKEARDAS